MIITVDEEKMQKELKRVQLRLDKRREESLFTKVEDKNDEER